MTTTQSADPLTPPKLTPGAARILETAADLFYTRGIHAVGVDAIAAESGKTKRTLYDRFGSKDALVVAYLQLRHDGWWKRLEARLATLDDDARPRGDDGHSADGTRDAKRRVLAVVDSYTLDSTSTIERGCGFINAAAELPADHPGRTVIRAHKTAVVDLLTEILADGEFSAPTTLAEHLFLVLEGAIVQRGIDGDDHRLHSARDLVERLLD